MFNDPSGMDPDGDSPPVKAGDSFIGDDGLEYFYDSDEVIVTPKLKRATIDFNNINYNTYLIRANEIATEFFNPEYYGNDARKELGEYFDASILSYITGTKEGEMLFGDKNVAFINDFIGLVEQMYNSQYYTAIMNGGANSPKWQEYNTRIDNALSLEEKASIIWEREQVEHWEYEKFMFGANFAAKQFPLMALGGIAPILPYGLNTPTRTYSFENRRKLLEFSTKQKQFDLNNPNTFTGAKPGEVRDWLVQNGWRYERLTGRKNTISGFVYTNGRTGEQIRIMPGSKHLPTEADPIKGGPYMKISIGAKTSEPIPLYGNPILKN